MFTTTIGLLALCVILLVLSIAPMRMFRMELAQLPERRDPGDAQHPILGVSLQLVLPVPDEVKQTPAVVILADPACRSCKGEMQDLIRARSTAPIPAVCFYEHEEVRPEAVAEFLEQFGGTMPLIPVSSERLRKLGIENSPFVFLIDETGTVVRVQRPMKRLTEFFIRTYGLVERPAALVAKEQM